jgi:hypothetical protein
LQQQLKVLSRQVHNIAIRYRQAKVQMMMFLPSTDANQQRMHAVNVKFVETFQYILNSMIPENRQIIVNDYLERKHHHWWFDLYARSTYYRLKNKALQEFLSYLV